MTTERPDADSSARPAAAPLRRRASDRVLGGVAAGIADYFSIDPLLVRAAFVGLMIFGGAGLVLYVGAWLLIPAEDADDSILQAAARRVGLGSGRGLVIFALIAFVLWWLLIERGGYIGGGLYLAEPWALLVIALVLLGIVLLSRGGSRSEVAVAQPAGATAERVVRPVAVRTARPRVPRGPLGWYTVAAVLLGIGLLALVDNASEATVMPGQFFGLTLAIVGSGLVIGSWWSNARLLILPALLVLPLAFAASFVSVPLEGGTGVHTFLPVNAQELRDEYRLAAGGLTLDLRELEADGEPVTVEATVAVGHLTVFLPARAQLHIESEVGAGALDILEDWQEGTDLANLYVRGDSGQQFILDLAVGIGEIRVSEQPSFDLEGF